MKATKNKTRILIVAIILMTVYGLLVNVNKPFTGMHDWNGAFYGILVRYYYKLGLWQTKFGQVSGYDSATKQIGYFIHYTPFLPLLFYFSTKIFGFFESSFRLITISFSLLFIVYIYRLGGLIKTKIGLLAALMISLTPMFLYYGKLPDHDPVVAALSTISVFYFLKYNNFPNKNNFVKFVFVWFFALIESWPAFFLMPGFFLVGFLSKKITKLNLLFILLFPLIIFLLFILYSFSLNGTLADLANVFKFRTNITENAAYSFTIKTYILTLARFFVIYYTIILLVLSVVGTFFLFRLHNDKKRNFATHVFLILLLYGAGYPVFFRNLCWIHDYKIIHFMPLIAIFSGAGIYYVIIKLKSVINKKFIFLLLLPLSFFVFNERKNYLTTIIQTGHASQAYEIGKYMKAKMADRDKVVIFPKIFGTAHSTFVSYYAEKQNIRYEDDLNSKLNNGDDYLILAGEFNNAKNISLFKQKYSLIMQKDYSVFKRVHNE